MKSIEELQFFEYSLIIFILLIAIILYQFVTYENVVFKKDREKRILQKDQNTLLLRLRETEEKNEVLRLKLKQHGVD